MTSLTAVTIWSTSFITQSYSIERLISRLQGRPVVRLRPLTGGGDVLAVLPADAGDGALDLVGHPLAD